MKTLAACLAGALLTGCLEADATRYCPNGWVILDYYDDADRQQWEIRADEGECLRATSLHADVRFFDDESCRDGQSCVVLSGDGSAVIGAAQIVDGTLGTFDRKPLRDDGSCPLACELGGGS
jgi:hypothetical protein